MLFSQQRYAEAQYALERAVNVSNAPKIYWRLGETLETSGQAEAALQHYEEMMLRRLANPVQIRRKIARIREITRGASEQADGLAR